jgi:hypothetical protein
MKLRSTFALVFFAFLAATIPTHAQLGIYGNFQATHDSLSSGQASFWTYGPNAGVYYNFVHLGPIALGADARANYLFGDQYKYRSALFGVRVAAKAPLLPLRPYAQFSIGAGGPKYNGNTGQAVPTISPVPPNLFPNNWSTKFQYMVFGGLDTTVAPHIDLRVAEIGYGRMSGVNNGNSGNNPTDSLFTIGSGVVFRFF